MSDATEIRPSSAPDADPQDSMMRRLVRGFGWGFIGLGLFLLGFVGHQLFVTTWFAQQHNTQLEAEANEYFAEAEIGEVAYVSPGAPTLIESEEQATESESEPEESAGPRTLLVEQPPPEGQPLSLIHISEPTRLQ